MTALVVGIDGSSRKLAMFAIHPVLPTTYAAVAILHKSKYSPDAAAEAMDGCFAFLDTVHKMATPRAAKVAWIESPVVGRGGPQAALVQAFVSGVVQACFVKAGFKVHMVHQSTWKAWLGVSPTAKTKGNVKPDVVRAMRAQFPKDWSTASGDPDILDAAAIARYGANAVRLGDALAGGWSV